jgi:hypothetical protein
VREYLELPTTNLHTWINLEFNTDKAICEAVFSQIKTAPHGKQYASCIAPMYNIFQHHMRQAANDIGLQKLAVELDGIVFEYGVPIPGDPESSSTRNHGESSIPGRVESSPQDSGSAAGLSIGIASEPTSSKKQSSPARRFLHKIIGKKDTIAGVAVQTKI